MFVEVAVSAPLHKVLTYSLDQSQVQGRGALHGCRVLVPLASRKVTGFIVGTDSKEQPPEIRTRKVISILDSEPFFHPDLLPFFRWIAEYYHYPLGLVLKAALPAGLSQNSSRRLVVVNDSWKEEIAVELRKHHQLLQKLLDQGYLAAGESKKLLKDKATRRIVNRGVKEKMLALETTVRGDSVKPRTEDCCTFSPSIWKWLEEKCGADDRPDARSLAAASEKELGQVLKVAEARLLLTVYELVDHETGICPLREARKQYPSTSRVLGGLVEKGWLQRLQKRVYRSPTGQLLPRYQRPENLTREQKSAVDEVMRSLDTRKFQTFLLHGVTGCGKTEVYLRAAEHCLKLGRDVLVLVPEIALATQIEAHFVSRFGEQVVVMHSGLTAGERFDQYSLALNGKARVVIGARSAVFAPLADPGLIVVDEEHDPAYKQDESFRYNGRDIAVLRGKHHGSVVLLGSATPSVTSYANATSGKYHLLKMEKRVQGQYLPTVNIVDLNDKANRGNGEIIGLSLEHRLRENLETGDQSILLMNRRGYSTVMICRDCGTTVQCEHCHVSLTLHMARNRLLCHYCGFTAHPKGVCVQCRSHNLSPAGFGTERVEEEVRTLFPEARIERIDRDIAVNRKRFLQILAAMQKREIDILIGTQMISKGLHFPAVTLVGVVWADGGMNLPDFRAAERTYQLVSQVTGRAGRGVKPGMVIIQTNRPDHYSLGFAKLHDYKGFFEQEMELRRSPEFPPYVRLALLRIDGTVEKMVMESAKVVAECARRICRENRWKIRVLGPAPSPLDKLRDRYRWQVLFKGDLHKQLHQLVTSVREEPGILQGKTRLIIDIDPENMM